jgi:succinoglycan biosynthesis transport protein ExoP
MSLQQLLLTLLARYKVVLLTLLATVAAAVGISLLLPKQYTATAAVVIDVKSPDPIVGMMLPALVMPGYMATQVNIVESNRVARQVVHMLKLDQSPAAREEWLEATDGKGELDVWLADALQKKLDVKPSRESSVINISFRAVDPRFAAALANAFAQAYIDTNIELKVEPAKQYAHWFGEQGKALRDNVESAQARLSEYQQVHGIVASDERLDIETAKLNDLAAQLTIVQGQTTDAQSKQHSGSASSTLPEVVLNPLIQNLKADIARQEGKLQEMAGNLGKNHPQYQRMESEVALLKQKLEEETRHITSGFSTSRAIGKDKQAELKAAIGAQKKLLLELKHKRDELAVLTRDVEAAQKAYDAVSQRFNQTRLESQSTQTNVSVLTPAAEPSEPSFPKMPLNILLSIFVGSFFGVGAAVVLEILDRRIRSADDLAEMLQLPVLGVIGPVKGRGRLAVAYRKPALTVR